MIDYVIRNDMKAPLRSLPIGVMTSDVIFHCLSNINRFSGMRFPMADEPFTVLEHSLAVAEVILDVTGNAELARMGLWHDAAEAFLGDIATPVKNILGRQYADLEACVEEQVLSHNSISDNPELRAEVTRYDKMCCIAEIMVMTNRNNTPSVTSLMVINDWFDGYTDSCDIHIISMFVEKLKQLYHVRVSAHTDARQAMRNRAHRLDHALRHEIENGPLITTHQFNGYHFRITRNKDDKIINIEIMG